MPGVEAQSRAGVQDGSRGDPACNEGSETGPSHPALLASPLKCTRPVPDELSPKAVQTIQVAGNGIVVEVALYD